ncbi:hypothetical protein D3C76_1602950 [compost metagenome]
MLPSIAVRIARPALAAAVALELLILLRGKEGADICTKQFRRLVALLNILAVVDMPFVDLDVAAHKLCRSIQPSPQYPHVLHRHVDGSLFFSVHIDSLECLAMNSAASSQSACPMGDALRPA